VPGRSQGLGSVTGQARQTSRARGHRQAARVLGLSAWMGSVEHQAQPSGIPRLGQVAFHRQQGVWFKVPGPLRAPAATGSPQVGDPGRSEAVHGATAPTVRGRLHHQGAVPIGKLQAGLGRAGRASSSPAQWGEDRMAVAVGLRQDPPFRLGLTEPSRRLDPLAVAAVFEGRTCTGFQ